MARPVTRPEGSGRCRTVPPPIDAGPTAVHCLLERASTWLSVKMRKLAVTLSLPGSPRPEVGSGFWKVSDQPVNVPVPPGRRVVRDGQHPGPLHAHAIGRGREDGGQRLLRVERGEERWRCRSWIGVAALSSKTVLLKLAVVVPVPTPLKSVTEPSCVAAGSDMGQRRRQIGIGGIGQADLDLHDAGARRGLVALDDEVVGHGDRGGHLARGHVRPAPESTWGRSVAGIGPWSSGRSGP